MGPHCCTQNINTQKPEVDPIEDRNSSVKHVYRERGRVNSGSKTYLNSTSNSI